MTERTAPPVERRRYPRRPHRDRTITFFANNGLSKEMDGLLLDSSPEGIGIHTQEPLQPGTILLFEHGEGIQLPARGRVIWVLHQAGGGYRVGIQFIPAAP